MRLLFPLAARWLPVLISVSGRVAFPQSTPPATLMPGDGARAAIGFTWRQMTEGKASVPVTSTKDQKVHVQEAELTCFGGLAATLLKVGVTPGEATASTNVPVRFQLSVAAEKPVPGTCVGPVVFRDDANNAVAQTVTVSVAGPELVPTKLSVVLWRWVPWPYARLVANDFPFAVGTASDLQGLWGRETGSISRGTDGWTRVYWNGKDRNHPEPRLVIDTPPAAGTYSGDLVLADDPVKVQVSLTAMVKDIVVWPALTIVLGVALAYMVKRYAGVLRVTWALRAQVADLDGEFRAAQAQFERDTEGQSFVKYSIGQELKTRRDSVLAALSGIERSVASTLDSTNSNYQNAVATVQSLQSGVGLWQGLGGQMADLSAGLERLEGRLNGADQEPPVTQGDKPAFVSTARDLLNGKTIAVSAVTAISQNAATLGALAKLWLAVRDRAAGLTAEYRRLRAQTGLPAPQVANLGTAIVSMWVHVLGVQDAAGLNGLLMNGADLDQCTVQIEQLKEIAGSEGRALGLTSAMFSAMSSVQAGEDPVDALVRAGTEAPGENRQAEFLRTRIAEADVASAVFSCVVALLTGLNLFYLGKAFGTNADYVSVFVWAAGTNVALGLITATIDRFTSTKPTV